MKDEKDRLAEERADLVHVTSGGKSEQPGYQFKLSVRENLLVVRETQTWIILPWTVSSLWSDNDYVLQGFVPWG